VTVVDSKGAPVTDAKLASSVSAMGRRFRGRCGHVASGEYVVMDDMALPLCRSEGLQFVVRVSRGKQTVSTFCASAYTEWLSCDASGQRSEDRSR
jgi:hypothetical protein